MGDNNSTPSWAPKMNTINSFGVGTGGIDTGEMGYVKGAGERDIANRQQAATDQQNQAAAKSQSDALAATNASQAAESKRESDAQAGLAKDNSFENAYLNANRRKTGTSMYGGFNG